MHTRLLFVTLLLGATPALVAQTSSVEMTAPYQRQAVDIYRTSIGFRTAVSHDQVPALANYPAGQLRAGGFPDEDVHVLPLTARDGDHTAILIARYRGDGSSTKQPILRSPRSS